MTAFSAAEALAIRMRRQGLAGRRILEVAKAAQASAGIQAQDLAASQLAVRARSHRLDQAAVERACGPDPAVVRTWLMRGTLHMVAVADARWLVGLLGPGVVRQNRRRRAELGLDEDICARALAAIPTALEGESLTRAELVRALAGRGVAIDPSGQAPAHLVLLAAASGLICRGPDRGTEPTYVLLDRWAPAGPRDPIGDAAAVELARRYLDAFGPAGTDDFAYWSGQPAGRARAAIEGLGPTAVSIAGQPAWLTGEAVTAPAGSWRLLPAFDSYLLGYRGRGLALDPAYAHRIHAGGGWIHPAVICDGRVVGRWGLRRKPGLATVAVELFGAVGDDAPARLAAEAADIGRFLDRPTALTVDS